ncbi:hypothetical protein F2Q69_00018288 [Brassica cretica]|uniref:Uncharacterized protein n=1 Tax=Brassica cretica TaxID=69181 RepID=A0A8S9Q8E4_BRACR|nr:hypothetical protein F2Q69_00018288 [Brassica cretica]
MLNDDIAGCVILFHFFLQTLIWGRSSSAKTASESDPLARIEPQKLDENGRDYDDDDSTSPKSNEASLSLPTEPKSPYIEEPKLADEQLIYYFPRPAPPLGSGGAT